ncbi:hypothetical protein CRG98_015518 [Punica granatum]|uniref:Uncharacterized protein n=1 Tax=Punica granatum TaxID=22663 RepID=A0A2I0K696_PUNGR|nr:hypothetical protein CRG98_015518 [Punica granatum]
MAVEERCKFLVLGKGRTGSNGLEVHVFCLMLKEKRYAVKLIAGRWKLAVNSASWELERFVVVHVTSKSKPPSRVLGFATSDTEEECEVPLAGFEESPILRDEDGTEETEDLLPVLESRESMTGDQNSCHESLVEPKLDESVWSNPSLTSPSSLISNYCGAREVVERR